MNRVIFLVFLFFVGILTFSLFGPSDFLGARKYYYVSACEKPILYKIGKIDSRFNLTNLQVYSAMEEASAIWNNSLGRKLFEYSSDASLSVNMVYDKRQFLSTKVSDLGSTLEANKGSLNKAIRDYKENSEDFERKLAEFGKKIDYWNSQGGATEEEFNKLITEQKSLQEEAKQLQEEAKQLNLSTSQYNTQVNELNRTIDSLNSALLVSPEEGLYDQQNNRIAIYFNNNRNELVRTIAHELGHVRELRHIEDKKAIMYPSTTQFLNPVSEEIEQLKEICRPRPFYEPLIERITIAIDSLK